MGKNKDYEQKFENFQVKLAELDIFSMFKDSGDGNNDAAKIMIKSLEEKIFKKFDLVDKRYKNDSLENLKIKSSVENILPKIDQICREINKINEIGNQNQEDIQNYKKENEIKALFGKSIEQVMNELKEEFDENINDKIISIENKINNLKNNNGDNFDLLKLGLGNNNIKQETIDVLEKKINDLRKKTNDIENTFKIYMNKNDPDSIKNELKDIKFNLDKKITKDDLKELYNFHLNTMDDLNDLKDQETKTYDELRKTIRDLQNLQQRTESINGNLSLLLKNPKIGGNAIIDFGKYVDRNKLTETLKPILKEFEIIYREIQSLSRDMFVKEDENKKNISNTKKIIDEETNNKINEFKNYIQKKFIEKNEYNKIIKSLEVQIKSIREEAKKDSDNWLLAKKPLNCFNCASCEANVKNENSTADYLAWKKYPRGEKIHRMGQGFSHMLQMMTSEFVKSIEKSEFPQEFDVSRNNNSNFINTQFNNKSTGGIIINKKEGFIENLKKLSKLPRVKQFSNSKIKLKKYDDSLPVSDDENNYLDNFNIENEMKKQNSPKIVKITKKEKLNEGKGSLKSIYSNMITQGKINYKETNFEPGKNNMFLKTEKNT